MENKLKVQIWSDIMCPFCYIGKRRIEEALNLFEYKDSVAIEWKSYQLDPNFVASPNDSMVAHLANKYGKDAAWAKGMLDNMTQNAKTAGLDFHFDKAILANSFNAHRLLHLAKKYYLSNELEELLFKAYLTDGENINDLEVLKQLGILAGLTTNAIDDVLNSEAYSQEVTQDGKEAQSIGVQGVPFFVFDGKYAVSGAQPAAAFLETLQKTWEEGKFGLKATLLSTVKGDSCGIDGCN